MEMRKFRLKKCNAINDRLTKKQCKVIHNISSKIWLISIFVYKSGDKML